MEMNSISMEQAGALAWNVPQALLANGKGLQASREALAQLSRARAHRSTPLRGPHAPGPFVGEHVFAQEPTAEQIKYLTPVRAAELQASRISFASPAGLHEHQQSQDSTRHLNFECPEVSTL